jgi:septal ring factor EnvC (AmiA/AmiB activator)
MNTFDIKKSLNLQEIAQLEKNLSSLEISLIYFQDKIDDTKLKISKLRELLQEEKS